MAKGQSKRKSKVHYEVSCNQHGAYDPKRVNAANQVKVGAPKSKNKRLFGCPLCKRAKRMEETQGKKV